MRTTWSGILGMILTFGCGAGLVTMAHAQTYTTDQSTSQSSSSAGEGENLGLEPVVKLSPCRPGDIALKHADVVALLKMVALARDSKTSEDEQFESDLESFAQASEVLEMGECLAEGTPLMSKSDFDSFYRPILEEYALATLYDMNSIVLALRSNGVRVSTTCEPTSKGTFKDFPDFQEAGFTTARCCKVRFCSR